MMKTNDDIKKNCGVVTVTDANVKLGDLTTMGQKQKRCQWRDLLLTMALEQMLKARRTCSMISFGMKTRREGTQMIKMIELPLINHQHHKDLKF
ncbi:hypothetical protein Hanom_Chr04g00317761 [Helianthus anomalus]